MKTEIKWEQIDYLEAVRYITLNRDDIKCRTSTLRRVLPTRRGTRGSRPGMRGAWPTGPAGPSRGDTEQWICPKVILTRKDKRNIDATEAEIMTEAMFKKIIKQEGGGPISLRSNCSVARLVIKIWDDKWLELRG